MNNFVSDILGLSSANKEPPSLEFQNTQVLSPARLRSGTPYQPAPSSTPEIPNLDSPVVTQPLSPGYPPSGASGRDGLHTSDFEGEDPGTSPNTLFGSLTGSRSPSPNMAEEADAEIARLRELLAGREQQLADKEGELQDKARWEGRLADLTGEAIGRSLSERKGEDIEIKRVTPCDGTDEGKLLSWLRDIDLVPNGLQMAVIHGTARGPLLAFVRKEAAGNNYGEIIRKVRGEFLGPAFEMRARKELSNFRQRPTESVPAFSRDFRDMVKAAYPVAREIPQQDIVLMYAEALADRAVSIEVLRRKPETLDAAIQEAKTADATFGLLPKKRAKVNTLETTDGESSSDIAKALNKLTEELPNIAIKAGEAAAKKAVTATFSSQKQPQKQGQYPPQRSDKQQNYTPKYRENNTDPCFRCKKRGHRAADCRVQPPQGKCPYCGRKGHWLYDCRDRKAGSKPCPTWRPPRQQQEN